MRNRIIDIIVESDVDLIELGCKRLQISLVSEGSYRIRSAFSVYSCERHAVVSRALRRRRPGLVAIAGQCSAPSGYFWSAPDSWTSARVPARHSD